jgi:hypothetical protein
MVVVAQRDLDRPDLEELDWSIEHRSASLSTVYRHATALAAGAERWYADRRRGKRRWGRALRAGAIVSGTAAVILPILGQIYTNEHESPVIAPAWAAVALAIAGALVALDRFFGFSPGWARFMATELTLTRLRHDFQYAWQEARAAGADSPSDVAVLDLLAHARTFVLAVDDAIAKETGDWIEEFRTTLKESETKLENRS